MTALTGLGAWEWLLFVLYALGVVLVVQAATRDTDGSRVSRILVVPAAAGVVLCAALAVAFADDTRRIGERFGDRAWSYAVALVAIVAAIAFADLLLTRFVGLAAAAVSRVPLGGRRGDVALLLAVGLPVVVALAATHEAEGRISSAVDSDPHVVAGASVRSTFTLPGHPMDLVFRSADSGYVSFGEGSIARFDLSGGGLELETVATGWHTRAAWRSRATRSSSPSSARCRADRPSPRARARC